MRPETYEEKLDRWREQWRNEFDRDMEGDDYEDT